MHIRCCILGTGYGLYSTLSDGFACRGATVETEWARRRTLTSFLCLRAINQVVTTLYKVVLYVLCPAGRNLRKINKENPWSLPALK